MELFERGDELATLRRELVLARESGRVVTVSGDAGTGKTSLIRAALEAGGGDFRVLRGLCDPLTTPRPLGPIRDALGQPSGLVRGRSLPDDLRTVEEQLLGTVAASPTVLVIEDAQWIDAASAETLRYLVRRADALPVLVVISYRHDAIGLGHPALALLGDIARSESSTAIRLGALSPDAVAQLLGDGGPDPARVHAITGGNPFFVAEIGRHPDETLPQTVRDVVLASTTSLDPADLETLQLVSTAPDGLDDRLLPALGISVPALRRMEQTGLLSRTRRGIVFRHELARLAIAETVSREDGAVLHGRLLDALEAVGLDDAAVLAHHARAAGDAERTLRYALLAADESRRTSSHTEAVAFLSLALTLVDDPAARAALLEQLSAEQYMISRLPDAIASIESALRLHEQLHDLVGTASAHDRRAIVEYYSARRHEAERHAALSAQAATGTEAFAASQTTRAYLAYRRHDVSEARRLSAQARIAVTADDHASRIRLDITEAAADLVEGEVSARDRLLRHGLVAIERSLDEVGTTAFSNLSALDIEQRRLAEAESVLDRSIPLTVELDIPICRQWQTGQRARLHLLRGRRARMLLQERGLRVQPARPQLTTRVNPSGLTNRQLDVARLLARGFTNSELAKRLYISPRTADHHVSAILAKLGLSNRRDVIRLAGDLGLT